MMPEGCSDLLNQLSDRPEISCLREFMARLLQVKGKGIEFVVLFGSRAKGNWTGGSDYDILIGLRYDDGMCFLDRLPEFSLLAEGPIEVFPYCYSEWRAMFQNLHLLPFGSTRIRAPAS